MPYIDWIVNFFPWFTLMELSLSNHWTIGTIFHGIRFAQLVFLVGGAIFVGGILLLLGIFELQERIKKKAKLEKLKKTLENKAKKVGITYEQVLKEIEEGKRGKTGNPKSFYNEKRIAEDRERETARN